MARIFEDGEINGLKIVAEDKPKSVDEVCGFMRKALTAVLLAFFGSVPKCLSEDGSFIYLVDVSGIHYRLFKEFGE